MLTHRLRSCTYHLLMVLRCLNSFFFLGLMLYRWLHRLNSFNLFCFSLVTVILLFISSLASLWLYYFKFVFITLKRRFLIVRRVTTRRFEVFFLWRLHALNLLGFLLFRSRWKIHFVRPLLHLLLLLYYNFLRLFLLRLFRKVELRNFYFFLVLFLNQGLNCAVRFLFVFINFFLQNVSNFIGTGEINWFLFIPILLEEQILNNRIVLGC